MLISSVIYWGERSFNSTSTPSTVEFNSRSSTTFTRAHTAYNVARRPCHEPLPSIEGCGLDFHHHCSLTSQDAAHGLALLDGGSGEGGSRGGTHKVGGPGGVTKHEPRRLSWFVFAIHDTTTSGGNDDEVVVGGNDTKEGNDGEREGETRRKGKGKP